MFTVRRRKHEVVKTVESPIPRSIDPNDDNRDEDISEIMGTLKIFDEPLDDDLMSSYSQLRSYFIMYPIHGSYNRASIYYPILECFLIIFRYQDSDLRENIL